MTIETLLDTFGSIGALGLSVYAVIEARKRIKNEALEKNFKILNEKAEEHTIDINDIKADVEYLQTEHKRISDRQNKCENNCLNNPKIDKLEKSINELYDDITVIKMTLGIIQGQLSILIGNKDIIKL